MQNFSRKGDSIMKVLSGTVSSGDAIALEDRAGICTIDGVANDEIPVLVEGVVTYAKVLGVFAAGEKLYFDSSEDEVTNDADSGTNKPIGWAAAAAASTAEEAEVKLGAF